MVKQTLVFQAACTVILAQIFPSKMITKLTSSHQLQTYYPINHWHAKQAAIQCNFAPNQTVCMTTTHYPFYLSGKVDYTNFSEDYHYHGSALSPPKPIDNRLSVHRGSHQLAQNIRQGDTISENGKQSVVQSVTPLRRYTSISTSAMQSGNGIGLWQRWQFGLLFCLQSIDTNGKKD